MHGFSAPSRPEPASTTCSIWCYFGHKGVTGRGIDSAFRGWPRRRIHYHNFTASSPETNEQRVEMWLLYLVEGDNPKWDI